MIDESTLSKLLTHMTEIQDLCRKYGLGNLRLYEPVNIDDWVKINFLADKLNENISFLHLAKLKEEIKKILDCEVWFTINTTISEDTLKRISIDAISFSEDNKDNITTLFNDKLLPKAKRYQQKWGPNSTDAFEDSNLYEAVVSDKDTVQLSSTKTGEPDKIDSPKAVEQYSILEESHRASAGVKRKLPDGKKDLQSQNPSQRSKLISENGDNHATKDFNSRKSHHTRGT